MSLTAEQAQAAFAPGSVAVVAGAGTGKTHMLTSRYLHHLAQGLSPLEIVAVTFTERAADELKARVRRAALRSAELGPEAQAYLEAAQISTLHALAARICRDHPDAAEVPADFGVLGDLDKPVWLAEQFGEALRELEPGVLEAVPYGRLRTVLWQLVQEPSLAEAAFAHGPETWPARIDRARSDAAARLSAQAAWQEAARTVRAYQGAATDLIEIARQHALAGLEALGRGEPAAALAHFGAVKRNGGVKKNWPQDALQPVKDALGVLQALTKAARQEGVLGLELGHADEQLAALLPELEAAFDQVQARLRAAKRQARVLDFADLELHALMALEHAPAREHYRQRWQAFLIDEFQDTSPVQAALLSKLTEHATVTLVGDEKQAIYGFRGADAAVFEETRRGLGEGGGTLVALSESFRTHAPLVEAVNTVFAPVLGAAHQALRAWRTDAPQPAPHLTLQAVSAERGVRKLARRVQEARTLGENIMELIAAGTPVHDAATGKTRPLCWGDIAILTRTWAPLDTFSEVLSALGVPVVHTGGGNLLDTREAKDGLALVRFLADPHDDLALVALLRSPLFAADDRTLTTFAQTLEAHAADPPMAETPVAKTPVAKTPTVKPKASWWDVLQTTGDAALASAAATLRELTAERRRSSPTRLLQRADFLTGYSAVLANLPGAARRQADWAGFIDLVRRLEGGLGDIFAVARRLRRLLHADADLPRPTLEAGDAVALMTVHKAKGLEWPLVVLADLDYAPRDRTPEVLIDRHSGVAFCLQDEDGQELTPALYTLLRAQAKADAAEEARRVLYVALTRARDRLILSATQTKGGGLELLEPGFAALELSCEALPHDPALSLYPALPTPDPPPAGRRDDPDAALWSRSAAALGRYARYLEAKTPTTPLTRPDATQGVWDEVLEWAAELDEIWVPHLQALREAGLAAPHPDTVGQELTVRGAAAPYAAVGIWPGGGAGLALVDAAVPTAAYDQQLVRVDPADLPETTTSLVQDALKGKLCAS